MSARGVVAAGNPQTAEAGAAILREGGNAVDAAVAAMLASFVVESPLTGLGAGGYMLVHTGDRSVLLDFFVSVPGAGGERRAAELVPTPIWFTPETPQTFHVGAASVGVPGTLAGIEAAIREFGSAPLDALVEPAVSLAREGFVVDDAQGFILRILEPILTLDAHIAALYAPEGRPARSGDRLRFGEVADALERFGAEGAEPFYRGDVARALSDWVIERGGTLGRGDLAAYEPIAREPLRARFAGREVLTNPPPSAGGILIAFVLDVLERAGTWDTEAIVAAMDRAQAARTEDFLDGLVAEGFAESFLSAEALDSAAAQLQTGPPGPGEGPAGRLGSTTHISVIDQAGGCASVTCSNGSGSGVLVPGTGVHLNNMLGEEDLNPHGFHRHAPGRRLPSMMSPSVVLMHDGELEAALGSGGSNRIRSAVSQTIVRLFADGVEVGEAVSAPRVHYEDGLVQAEPGSDERALGRLEERGYGVVRWDERNVFFGGVHAAVRDPGTGAVAGGGDPRRGGAVAYA